MFQIFESVLLQGPKSLAISGIFLSFWVVSCLVDLYSLYQVCVTQTYPSGPH